MDLVKLYKQTYSVSEMMRQTGLGRAKIVSELKDAGVYEGLKGENYLKAKAKKHKKNMLAKYGVENISQLRQPKNIQNNKISYEKPELLKDFEAYKEYTNRLTRRNKKHIPDADYCYYTGVKFADKIKEEVNPNDWFKRTVDHRKPIFIAFIEGWPPEQCAALDNLVYVCRLANSIKSNTDHEAFLPIAETLRQKFMEDGYEVS